MKKVNYKKAVVGFADMAFSFMPFALTLAFSVSLYSCSEYNAKSMACKTARNSVNFTVNDPSLKILNVSTPDSVVDGCMFSEQDKRYLMNLITESSNDVFASLYEEDDTDKLIEKFMSRQRRRSSGRSPCARWRRASRCRTSSLSFCS